MSCAQCGAPLQQAGGGEPPRKMPNYLVQSILVTLCCCLPFGIPAIVFAAQVNGKLAAGDIQGAIDASNKAKMWSWIAFGLGITASVLGFLLQVIAGVLSSGPGMHR